MSNRAKLYIAVMSAILIIEFVCLGIYLYIGGPDASSDGTRRYICQMAVIVAYVLAALAIWISYKFYLKTLIKTAYEYIGKKVRGAIRFISGKIVRFINKLGLGGRKRLAKGSDEYSFTFDDEEKAGMRLHVSGVKKWKDLEDNSEKIRFLFIRYMIRKIRKGYKKRRGKTPSEWASDLRVSGAELDFFGDYNAARYSGGRASIPDDAVDRAKEITEGKRVK